MAGDDVTQAYGTNFNSVDAKQEFVDYLMFQPTNGIWVCLSKINWQWGGTVSVLPPSPDDPNGKVTKTPKKNADGTSFDSSGLITGAPTTSLPTWAGGTGGLKTLAQPKKR